MSSKASSSNVGVPTMKRSRSITCEKLSRKQHNVNHHLHNHIFPKLAILASSDCCCFSLQAEKMDASIPPQLVPDQLDAATLLFHFNSIFTISGSGRHRGGLHWSWVSPPWCWRSVLLGTLSISDICAPNCHPQHIRFVSFCKRVQRLQTSTASFFAGTSYVDLVGRCGGMVTAIAFRRLPNPFFARRFRR